jgi:ABC-type phosphate transport system auxiliary subunit
MSRLDAADLTSDDLTFEQELAEVERSLQELKDRHSQVQQAETAQATLKQRQEQVKHQLQQATSSELKAELQQIQGSLDELEVKLESRLFSWEKPFWQIVRFGGAGLVIGWGLAFMVLRSPQPQPATPLPQPQQTQ